ncbi:hypothetical protein Q4575_07505 [Psychrosphaera sp. 1_MG-2023]|nr:hypothetical protein [Psychrosphaera sp. 1_MG-2023]MDO6719238.1 hypothetical protein [Psychrosphaera sp. 1_MG-2023]
MSIRSIATCISLVLVSMNCSAEDKNYPGLNSTQVGMQTIRYQESLKDFAGIGDLATDISVTNTVLYASSYTSLTGKWGFLLNTKSDVTKEYTKDTWSVGEYGIVQQNTSKLSLADMVAQGVYHVDDEFYVAFGGQLKTIGFVRSNFETIGRAAELNNEIRESDKYFTDPNPPQILTSPLAIEEDLTYFNAIAGIHYNTAFSNARKRLTWHVGANLALPVLATAKNSQLEQQYGIESIDESFNGFEARLNAGVSYEIKKGIALTFNADFMMAQFSEMSTTFKDENSGGIERTASIPDIDMSGTQFSFGILWIN